MPHLISFIKSSPVILFLVCISLLMAFHYSYAPPPINDSCTTADIISISGAGFDYGTFNSSTSDLTTSTGQAGEFFEFASDYSHKKSVWFEFTLETSRSIKIKLEAAPGSSLSDPRHSGVTLYSPSNCLPGSGNRLGSIISSGELERYCTTPGTYRIQVTAVDSLSASVFLHLTVSCPFDPIYPEVAIYDCPDKAFVFNGGIPLPQNSAVLSGIHAIECHSIEDASEYGCLPLPDKSEFVKSTWYVFTTGTMVDFLSFDFPVGSQTAQVGYRLMEGNVRNSPVSSLSQIDCGLALVSFNTRFIEFPCLLKPNTTYSLVIIFHRDFEYAGMNIKALQRGTSASGWPEPIQPPVSAANQLGALPALAVWNDRFDCSSYISKNICPPANPASGLIVIGSGNSARSYDLATWATFTLATDANIDFRYSLYHGNVKYHTRIFSKTLTNTCPSPDPSSDLYYEFSGYNGDVKCIPAGDYSIQVLSSSNDTFPSTVNHKDSWLNGYLGTEFSLEFTVLAHPSIGLFRLEAPDSYDDINGLAPLQNNVFDYSTPAVFVCANTVLPDNLKCPDIEKAIYREINIGDADGDGNPDEGLLTITGLRTDNFPDTAISYQFFKGDANQLATSAGNHDEGDRISGLVDHAGICITANDTTSMPAGLDTFCTCVTPGVYTLTSLGDVDNVGGGDAPGFKFNKYNTIHDSRANAELINIGLVPGAYTSQPDVFSCEDNLGTMPPCGASRKLVFREFYLPDSAVMIISEVGSAGNLLSLFNGRASDLNASLTLIEDCFFINTFVDLCTAFPPGWYTVVSYGIGPNYTDRKILNSWGDEGDVGKTTVLGITLIDPITPNYNRPHKAYQGGITDWSTPAPNNPNATTGEIYYFSPDTFCAPDIPFISDSLTPCGMGYNRVAFYVFEITKTSFVQIRNVDQTFYTEVYPFDVNAQPGDLLTVPPVYPCLIAGVDYRQICDLPPGKYTIAIHANDSHFGQWVAPSIYVDEAALSRFDHSWEAYDFDLVPATNAFVNGRPLDTHPTLNGQAPSRDVFYCTTGAADNDPTETLCNTQFNDLIYAQPNGIPKPQYLPSQPPLPYAQPWRNLWYTFKLSGSGICTLHADVLTGITPQPLIAVYESDVDADIPWATLQTTLSDPGNTIIPGLRLIQEHVDIWCNSEDGDIIFTKSGCINDRVRYYVVVSFDAHEIAFYPNLPNQAISLSIKYTPKPTFAAPYDERPTANVVNGLIETVPPYSNVPLSPGNLFVGPDFSLLCYTRNITDPSNCTASGKSAWFKFEADASGHFYTSLEEIGIPNGWYASIQDMSVWKESDPDAPLTERVPLNYANAFGHEWLEGCIDPGTYYLLVRNCSEQIDTIQTYRVVINLIDSPGDFCYNAIPIDVTGFTPVTSGTIIDCHSIGTDIGETPPVGNSCFPITGRKTTWFHARINAGPMVDLKFQLGENFTGSATDLGDLVYRILAGTCGAMTPIACSAGNINLTLNCLGPGDYYVQVSLPETSGPNSLDVEGTLSLTVTATPSNPQSCSDPVDPSEVNADFIYTSDCQTITFINLSTAGFDITYLWEFPDGTSNEINPVWTPPVGAGSYLITLTVTNVALNRTATITIPVSINTPFASYTAMSDTVICNSGDVVLDATVENATYLWDDNSTGPQRITDMPGTFWVLIEKEECEIRDTVIVTSADATRTITSKICPESNIIVNNQVFDINNPAGTVVIPNAHPDGCDSILTVNLSFHSPATGQILTTICEGDSYVFANQTLTQAGIYTDQLISARGCDSIVTLTLEVTPRQILNHDVSGCIGGTLLLSPAVSGPAYEWSTGPLSNTLTVNSPGNYMVSVSDLNGCIISEETFAVSFGVLSPPNVSVPDPVCNGSDVVLTATGSSGNYSWYDAAMGGLLLGHGPLLHLQNIQNDTTVFVEAFQEGIDTCISARLAVPIFVSTEPVVTVTRDTVICAGSAITLPWGEVVVPDDNTNFTHTWQYNISGCDSLILSLNVILEKTILDIVPLDYDGFGVTCFGAEDGMITATAINGTPPFNYIWNTGDTSFVLSNIPAGSYSVTTTTALGCMISGSIFLAGPPEIVLDAISTDLSCFGSNDGTVLAVASGGVPDYMYSLSGSVFQQNPKFENLSSGSFNLIVADSRGCMDSVPANLAEPPEIVLDLMAFSPVCPSDTPEGSISAMASGGRPPLVFAIGNGSFSAISDFPGLAPGSYAITVRDAAGCEVSADVEIEPTLPLTLTLSTISTLSLGDSIQLQPQINFIPDSLIWTPFTGLSCEKCLEPWAKPAQSTDYQIKIWSAEGCLLTAFVQLEVDKQVRIFIPNVFSPNSDAINDLFTVFAKGEVRSVRSLQIFDRWGNGVWEDINFLPDGMTGWDGIFKGKPAPSGVYAWVCEIELIDGSREILSGDVTLVR